jgi:hypothetical protein
VTEAREMLIALGLFAYAAELVIRVVRTSRP